MITSVRRNGKYLQKIQLTGYTKVSPQSMREVDKVLSKSMARLERTRSECMDYRLRKASRRN